MKLATIMLATGMAFASTLALAQDSGMGGASGTSGGAAPGGGSPTQMQGGATGGSVNVNKGPMTTTGSATRPMATDRTKMRKEKEEKDR